MRYIRQIIAVLATLILGAQFGSAFASEQAESTKKLLELTGGKRVKVVWMQGKGRTRDADADVMKFYDSKFGDIKDLPLQTPQTILFTQDGRYILGSVGVDTNAKVVAYDTESGNVKELHNEGPGNNLLAVWTDPTTKKIWIYVNDRSLKPEFFAQRVGPIYRFPMDEPDKRELFWDRTSSHMYLTFSADGTRACFEPKWENIGQLKLIYGSDGKLDQKSCEYEKFGAGCFPSMAPDNSYRLFRLDGTHRTITMCDADNKNQRTIKVNGMVEENSKKEGEGVWLTLWSTHPQFLTCMAPEKGEEPAQIYLGRFDKDFTKIENWVMVSNPADGKCWRSHSWVSPE